MKKDAPKNIHIRLKQKEKEDRIIVESRDSKEIKEFIGEYIIISDDIYKIDHVSYTYEFDDRDNVWRKYPNIIFLLPRPSSVILYNRKFENMQMIKNARSKFLNLYDKFHIWNLVK